MAKFMFRASYTVEGIKGLLKDGGTGRRAAVQKAVEGLGGKLESFYFGYGDHDAYVVCDLPDAAAAIGLSLAVNAAGGSHASTVPLITPEEMDAACKKSPAFRAPGA